MDNPRLPRLLYILLVLVCLAMMAYYYPLMPQRMAAHFGGDGHVNGWQSRDAFFMLMLIICSTSAIVVFFAPWQIASKSNARINLPNREFWLAPERREQTLRSIAALLAWFGCGLLFVLIAGSYLALQANLSPDHRFNSQAMLAVLLVFLIALGGLMISFVRKFQRTSVQP